MQYSVRFIACICFVLSGAASVSYQMIWMREAMTYFGVITPVLSSVLSVFMLGLAIGTLLFGRIARGLSPKQAIIGYIVIEIAIAVAANLVPFAFNGGYEALLGVESQTSNAYLFSSWLIITLTLLPVCTFIGATLPLIMRYLESAGTDGRNFGFLYFANLVGAVLGCLLPLILIELLGFRGALYATASTNLVVAALAYYLLTRLPAVRAETQTGEAISLSLPSVPDIPLKFRFILFLTGFVALGSEVVWIRAYTPAVTTTVYAFASILAVYLISNFAGTWLYLRSKEDALLTRRLNLVVLLMPLLALLSVVFVSDPLMDTIKWATLIGIIAICMCFGFITPYIIDHSCKNNPNKTAIAYAYNFAGCIIGPLFTTYLLFPVAGIKGSLVLYALMLVPVCLLMLPARALCFKAVAATAVMLVPAWMIPSLEDAIRHNGKLYRDHVGYVGAVGEGMKRLLTVNGIGMTYLTTITKNMTHLPLAHHHDPKSALVICFGMGTTVRSLTTWPELETIKAVELSEGVTKAMPYFHDNADAVLGDPRVDVLVDDGRRYLMRTTERYDVITIDPPPPIRASGSGLLYSNEFIDIAKARLNTGGILAHWLPAGDPLLTHAVINTIEQHFKHTVVMDSIEGWGLHILASDTPISRLSAPGYLSVLPASAQQDIIEWHPDRTIAEITADSLRYLDISSKKIAGKDAVIMSDDRLYNEFFRLRRLGIYNP